jgi:hypothetical protein
LEILLSDSSRDNRIARSIGYAQDILFRNNTTGDTWIEAISDSYACGARNLVTDPVEHASLHSGYARDDGECRGYKRTFVSALCTAALGPNADGFARRGSFYIALVS